MNFYASNQLQLYSLTTDMFHDNRIRIVYPSLLQKPTRKRNDT